MKLSTKGRYAARAMVDLAVHYGSVPVMLRDIAKRQDISLKYLEQIMAALSSSGLIYGMRGKNGGFLLARSPDKIRMREIIEAVEGTISPVPCVENPKLCKRVERCSTYELWAKVGKAIADVLDSVSLKDLMDKERIKMARADYCI